MAPIAPLGTPAARRARARILELTHEDISGPQFLHDLSQQLRIIVPFSASFWSGSDPQTTLAVSPLRLENITDPRQCVRFWEREFLVPDFNLFRDLARAEQPVASLYHATADQPARSLRFREFKQALGFGDELRGIFRCGGSPWGLVSLWRDEGEKPFSAAEEKLLSDLSAPIAAAFRRRALLRATESPDAPDAPGLLVFDQDGVLTSYNSQAERWLLDIPTTSFEPHDWEAFGVPVPTEVRSLLARVRAVSAGLEEGAARARVQSRLGQWLVIHGFVLNHSTDAQSSTAIVIEPARTSEMAPIIAQAYDLTPREQEVTQLIARGLPTSQIAAELFVSPHTVRDHIKTVFDKVGVCSRGELVARLFAEHYSEPLRLSMLDAPHDNQGIS